VANGGADLNAFASRRVHPLARPWLTGSVAALLVITAWSLASPIGSVQDSQFHLASLWCSDSAPNSACPIKENIPGQPRAYLPAELIYPSCFNLLPNRTSACTAGVIESGVASARPNQLGNLNPDGFYNAVGGLAGAPVQSRVVLMRIMSGTFSMAVIGLSALLLRPNERRVFLFLALVMQVPLGLFLAGSVNSSGASTAVVIAAVPVGLRLQRANQKENFLSPIAGAVVLFVAANELRKETTLFVALVLLSLTAHRITQIIRASRRNLAVVGGLIVAFVMSLGRGTGIADLIRAGTNGFLRSNVDVDISASLVLENAIGTFLLWFASIGGHSPSDVAGLGTAGVAVPLLTPLLLIAVLVSAVIRAHRCMSGVDAIAPVMLLGLAWLLPFWTLTVSGLRVGEQVQPRYILPLLATGVIVACLRDAPIPLWAPRIGPLELGGVSIAHSLALAGLISHYSFNGINSASISAIFSETPTWRWSSTSPALVWMAGTVAFTILSRSLQGRATQQPTLGRRDGIR